MSSTSTDAFPTELRLRRNSRMLRVSFDDGNTFDLPFEYLRVYSPSAEVRGHGPGQEVLQVGKEDVRVVRIEPVGSYAIRLVFSDGHDSGLYTWHLLHELGREQSQKWSDYLRRLAEAGHSRSGEDADGADAPGD